MVAFELSGYQFFFRIAIDEVARIHAMHLIGYRAVESEDGDTFAVRRFVEVYFQYIIIAVNKLGLPAVDNAAIDNEVFSM
jgi:hypothetical protein